ncbi:MAG: recombinase RecA [Pseudopedobacter sp.]|nr:recombinase RecA [Deinococcales bacterium]
MSKAATKVTGSNAANAADKKKAIETTMAQIEKQFGKGAIMKLGADARLDIQTISTGSLSLDVALGAGGIPRGRITEIYGPESGGKTTLALSVVAQAQKEDGVCAFIDAEHALDPVYAKAIGVDTDALLVSQPDSGEQALEIMELLIRSGAVDLIVVDSVAALTPRAEIEGEMGDSLPGLQARLMSQALRKLTPLLSRTNTAAIFINQVREKIGVMYGNPETTTGGRALKFYASIRMRVSKVGKPTEDTATARIKVEKNKIAAPFKEVELDLVFGKGFDQLSDLVTVAADFGILKKSGAFYSYGEERIGQGKDKAVLTLANNKAMEAEIRSRTLEAVRGGNKAVVAPIVDSSSAADDDTDNV